MSGVRNRSAEYQESLDFSKKKIENKAIWMMRGKTSPSELTLEIIKSNNSLTLSVPGATEVATDG